MARTHNHALQPIYLPLLRAVKFAAEGGRSPFPLKSLIPCQPLHEGGMGNPVMATDQEGIQDARIAR